jgi:hypothetical protein
MPTGLFEGIWLAMRCVNTSCHFRETAPTQAEWIGASCAKAASAVPYLTIAECQIAVMKYRGKLGSGRING